MDLNNLDRVFIIAEIGINHNGSLENIYKMIDAAKDSGADAVKLQVMTGYDLVDKNLKFKYKSFGTEVERNLADIFFENRVKYEWLEDIYKYCEQKDIICFATPFSNETIDELEKVGNPIYKISSGDITCTPLIEYAAKTGKPIIISTGKSTLADIDRALQTVESAGNKNVAILHCISVYPTPFNELNLNIIQSLEQTFNVPCGFSDHSEGHFSTAIAVAKGAKIIEKHFTLDKSLPGPDHWFSLDPSEFKDLVNHIRLTESMFGTSRKAIYKNEERVNKRASRSIVAKNDLPKGHVIQASDLSYKRPGTGIPPYENELIIGKQIENNISEGQQILFEDIKWETK